jgi:outer membrane protein OmpA-like peptidoglycan-associated protein
MNNQHSSYNFWTWLVAILLAILLLWALLTGRGTGTCCTAPVEAAPVAEVMPAAPAAVAESCKFAASSSEYTANEACTTQAWAANFDALKSSLVGDMRAEGDDKTVVLTGTVDTEEIKAQKGKDAEAFFGASVSVDNQLVVKVAEPVAMEAPPAAKLYFDTAKTALPGDSDTRLAPIIAWLSAHPDAKAVVSGFHDPRGNQKQNEDLAYNRAKAAQAALITAGIDVLRIELVKPEVTDGGGDLAEARRVEVSVK